MKDKLSGFGPLYIINLKRRQDRLNVCLNELTKYNVQSYEIIEAIDGQKDPVLEMIKGGGNLSNNELACTLSHLTTIKHWIETSKTEYAIIAEDDFSLETVDKWNFTWNEFLNSINVEFDMLQMAIINSGTILDIHEKHDNDFSTCMYLIKREFAKHMIDKVLIDDKYVLPERAIADHFLYKLGKTYSVPLIVYKTEMVSDINPSHISIHEESRRFMLDFWEKGGLTINKSI